MLNCNEAIVLALRVRFRSTYAAQVIIERMKPRRRKRMKTEMYFFRYLDYDSSFV